MWPRIEIGSSFEKYTKNKANDIVKGFLAVNSDIAYKEARKLLDQRFGNPSHVAESYKSRLHNWLKICDGDSNGLQEFSDFLFRCQEAVKAVGSTSDLDSTQNLLEVSTRLPSYSGVKWCRHAHEARAKSKKTIGFNDLVNFVKEEADLANDPIFSPDALRRARKPPSDTDKSKGRANRRTYPNGSSFVTSALGRPHGNTAGSSKTATSRPLCGSSHSLDDCTDFRKMNMDER